MPSAWPRPRMPYPLRALWVAAILLALFRLRRAGAADEFRANTEMLERLFPGGRLDEETVRRAAPGGDRDLAWLIAPSRARALLLDKASMAITREQSFEKGRDPTIRPLRNVHRRITDTATGLGEAGRVHRDGRLWLRWE